MYYIYQQKQILLGLRTCDNLQTKYNKKHDKHSTIAKNHNTCPTNLSLIPAEPALDNVMCPYPHSTSEVSPNTCQCLSISQYQRPLHSMPCTQLQPYTHTSQDHDVQFGGQYRAWSSGGGAGSGLVRTSSRSEVRSGESAFRHEGEARGTEGRFS